MDLARAAGLSVQTVRNYEAQSVIALARRTSSGYRAYDREHLDQLLAFTALARSIGHQDASAIMTAVTDGRTNDALDARVAVLLRHGDFPLATRSIVGDEPFESQLPRTRF